jgi:glutamate synthase domain-containing protein 1
MSDVYHVFTRAGDAVREVEAALDALKARGVSRDGAGLYKCMYVTRADQTVLMTETRDTALAAEVRARGGWAEPGDRPLN